MMLLVCGPALCGGSADSVACTAEGQLQGVPQIQLSTSYKVSDADRALSRAEQLRKFDLILSDPPPDALNTNSIHTTSLPLQRGWPIDASGQLPGSPAIGDLEGDGHLEVVIGSASGFLYAWHSDGTPVTGFPFQTGGVISGTPALADLDADGKLEIVFGSFDNKIYALHADGTLVAGWPVTTGDWIRSSASVLDLDGDGTPEIAIGSNDGKLYVIQPDGTVSCNFQTNGIIKSAPALADLNGDGKLEIIFASWDGNLYALHHDCTLMDGWPQVVGGTIIGSPSLGDLDNDGRQEIVVGTGLFGGNKLFAFHSDGTPVSGWPIQLFTSTDSSVSIVDLDGDGTLEVITGSNDGGVYVFNGDGTPLAGFSFPFVTHDQILSSPAVADVDGDGALDIIIGSDDNNLYAIHRDGTLVAGFPFNAGGDVDSSPAIADLDGDGDVEVIFGSFNHNVYVLDLPSQFKPSLTPWKTFRHDRWHTGVRSTFEDVFQHHWAWRFIETAYQDGITAGCIETNLRFVYCPAKQVSRAQMSVFLGRGVDRSFNDFTSFVPPPCGSETFSDVKCDYWAYKFVEYVAQKQVASGFGDGSFHPETLVTRAQMSVFLSRSRDLLDNDFAGFVPPTCGSETFGDVPCSRWAYKFVEYVASKGIASGFSDGSYRPDVVVTRDQMSVFLVRSFNLM